MVGGGGGGGEGKINSLLPFLPSLFFFLSVCVKSLLAA